MNKICGSAKFVFVMLAGTFLQSVTAQSQIDGFEERFFDSPTGTALPYRIHSPSVEIAAPGIPLIVYLHGSGGNGVDNVKQISGGNIFGTRRWIDPEISNENPAFVVAPQSTADAPWGDPNSDELTHYSKIVMELVDHLVNKLAIDPNRIYLMGQSKGGRGVWDILSKHPGIFAAGIPVCGSGNVDLVRAASGTPIWAFHGALDSAIRVEESRVLVKALEEVGGNIRYTEYPEVRHNSWEKAFSDPGLPIWLFAQRLNE